MTYSDWRKLQSCVMRPSRFVAFSREVGGSYIAAASPDSRKVGDSCIATVGGFFKKRRAIHVSPRLGAFLKKVGDSCIAAVGGFFKKRRAIHVSPRLGAFLKKVGDSCIAADGSALRQVGDSCIAAVWGLLKKSGRFMYRPLPSRADHDPAPPCNPPRIVRHIRLPPDATTCVRLRISVTSCVSLCRHILQPPFVFRARGTMYY